MSTTDERIFGARTSWSERARRAADNALVHLHEVKKAWEGSDGSSHAADESDSERKDEDQPSGRDESDENTSSPTAEHDEELAARRDDESSDDESSDDGSVEDDRANDEGDARDEQDDSRSSGRHPVRSMVVRAAPLAVAVLWARRRARVNSRRRFFKKVGTSVSGAIIGSAAVAAVSDRGRQGSVDGS